jgi:hypothetical protein
MKIKGMDDDRGRTEDSGEIAHREAAWTFTALNRGLLDRGERVFLC